MASERSWKEYFLGAWTRYAVALTDAMSQYDAESDEDRTEEPSFPVPLVPDLRSGAVDALLAAWEDSRVKAEAEKVWTEAPDRWTRYHCRLSPRDTVHLLMRDRTVVTEKRRPQVEFNRMERHIHGCSTCPHRCELISEGNRAFADAWKWVGEKTIYEAIGKAFNGRRLDDEKQQRSEHDKTSKGLPGEKTLFLKDSDHELYLAMSSRWRMDVAWTCVTADLPLWEQPWLLRKLARDIFKERLQASKRHAGTELNERSGGSKEALNETQYRHLKSTIQRLRYLVDSKLPEIKEIADAILLRVTWKHLYLANEQPGELSFQELADPVHRALARYYGLPEVMSIVSRILKEEHPKDHFQWKSLAVRGWILRCLHPVAWKPFVQKKVQGPPALFRKLVLDILDIVCALRSRSPDSWDEHFEKWKPHANPRVVKHIGEIRAKTFAAFHASPTRPLPIYLVLDPEQRKSLLKCGKEDGDLKDAVMVLQECYRKGMDFLEPPIMAFCQKDEGGEELASRLIDDGLVAHGEAVVALAEACAIEPILSAVMDRLGPGTPQDQKPTELEAQTWWRNAMRLILLRALDRSARDDYVKDLKGSTHRTLLSAEVCINRVLQAHEPGALWDQTQLLRYKESAPQIGRTGSVPQNVTSTLLDSLEKTIHQHVEQHPDDVPEVLQQFVLIGEKRLLIWIAAECHLSEIVAALMDELDEQEFTARDWEIVATELALLHGAGAQENPVAEERGIARRWDDALHAVLEVSEEEAVRTGIPDLAAAIAADPGERGPRKTLPGNLNASMKKICTTLRDVLVAPDQQVTRTLHDLLKSHRPPLYHRILFEPSTIDAQELIELYHRGAPYVPNAYAPEEPPPAGDDNRPCGPKDSEGGAA